MKGEAESLLLFDFCRCNRRIYSCDAAAAAAAVSLFVGHLVAMGRALPHRFHSARCQSR